MGSLCPRSAPSWARSIEAPARYSSHVARMVSGPEAAQIFGKHFRLQPHRIAQQRAQLVAQKELSLRADQPFRESTRLDQKEPVPASGRRLLVDRLEAVEGRHDVEQCHTLDVLE
jgi:hypothetical protein